MKMEYSCSKGLSLVESWDEMKYESIHIQEGKFFIELSHKKFLEFVPNQIHCEHCKRRISLKEYQKNKGRFECPKCSNSTFLILKVPKEITEQIK